jgi:SAM-dependent methyltransferase
VDKNKYIHYSELHDIQSAKEILPKLFELVKVKSVLDVGCGTGSWLKIVKDYGVVDYQGIDGIICEASQMHIESSKVNELDLDLNFDLGRKFDLVISVEVAEHLHPNSAENFVGNLTRHSDLILFSAAIPFQGGQNHLNEQWTDCYWVNIFKKFNYFPTDLLRSKIWGNQKIHWWYRQNIVLFVNADFNHYDLPKVNFSNYVHPELYIHKINEFSEHLEQVKSKYQSGDLLSFQLILNILLKKVIKKVKRIIS